MKRFLLVLAMAALGGCANGKMGQIDDPLDHSLITKTTPIYVESFSAAKATFTGDRADDERRCNEETTTIAELFHQRVAEQLRKRGYNAKYVSERAKSDIVISGNVTKIEHGSGATRFWVGFGAGSANMYSNIRIEDRARAKVLSKFQVIATSGGNSSPASFLDSHLTDGATKVAEYVANEVKE